MNAMLTVDGTTHSAIDELGGPQNTGAFGPSALTFGGRKDSQWVLLHTFKIWKINSVALFILGVSSLEAVPLAPLTYDGTYREPTLQLKMKP